jgi:hypothetical protein
MKLILFWIFIVAGLARCAPPAEYQMLLRVEAGNHYHINSPVYVELENREFDENALLCLHYGGMTVPAQVENIDGERQRIWWIVNLEPGESADYGLTVGDVCYTGEYAWEQSGEQSTRLLYDGDPVLQYEHPVFDPDDIEGTKKPYHHVFEPAGDDFITKGPGGLYSHHRGIFYGYNHVYLNDERVDIWHANEGERSEHAEMIREFAGPVMGGHEVNILWKDRAGNPFIEERRIIRAFRQPSGESLIDFYSVLRATDGPVRLEGDRQHAGVQFRAAQFVADNSEHTRFIRPAAWSHIDPAEEIEGEHMYDLPWNAMHFRIDDRQFTVSYMSHPSNPGNAEMSERLYGRFGEFFPYYLDEETPLQVNYRFWISEGEPPSVEQIDMRYQGYAHPYGLPTELNGIFGPVRHSW